MLRDMARIGSHVRWNADSRRHSHGPGQGTVVDIGSQPGRGGIMVREDSTGGLILFPARPIHVGGDSFLMIVDVDPIP